MIRVFPRRNKWTPDDSDAYVGSPPVGYEVGDPLSDEVWVSVTFTDDIEKGKKLQAEWSEHHDTVKLGGPAFDDLGSSFVPGRFLKHGVTITSRGCPNKCPWCWVPKREGDIRELPIQRGHIVQDNNLFACRMDHIEKVFAMLRTCDQPIQFKGGIDAPRFTEEHRALIGTIKLGELWFACDADSRMNALKRVIPLLKGIPRNKRRCFVMVGFNDETIENANQRIRTVYNLGFDPFAQFYRGPNEQEHTSEWKSFCRTWARPCAYRCLLKKCKICGHKFMPETETQEHCNKC